MTSSTLTLLVLTMVAAWCMRVRVRPEPVFDRVAFFSDLIGDAKPRIEYAVNGDPAKAAETFVRIGRVALAEKMAACDEITRGPFYTDRDFGDEDDPRRSA